LSNAVTTEQEQVADRQAAVDFAETVKEVRARASELTGRVMKLSKRVKEMRERITPETIDQNIEDLEEALAELDRIHDEQYVLVAAALSWRHSPSEVHAWCERTVAMGAQHPRFDGALLEDLIYERRVPNAPIRDQFERLVDTTERAYRHGAAPEDLYCPENYIDQCTKALECDERLLYKRLGIMRRTSATRGDTVSLFMDYDAVSRIAPILNLTPRSAGI
jgi:hypothetical protein